MRNGIIILVLLSTLTVGGCTKQEDINQQEIIRTYKNEIESKDVELREIKAENSELKETIETLQNELENLQDQMNEYGLVLDKLEFLKDNTYALQTVLENLESNLPRLDYGENELKKKILEEIDFQSKEINLEKEELMLSASIIHEVYKDTNKVLVECVVYKKLKNTKDSDSIDYLKMMFIDAEKVKDRWEVVGFKRGH